MTGGTRVAGALAAGCAAAGDAAGAGAEVTTVAGVPHAAANASQEINIEERLANDFIWNPGSMDVRER
ncbi:MAG TPA: hypothetical protein VLN49_07800 [Gemmatimonadaceae bacterium]|nr:hypothetical protein [Gemmatimonadaceae bacterium]